jgi:spermidine synthase
MRTRVAVHASVFLIGFCGVIAQVLALREMVVTFYGNELCMGVMLGAWLLWSGIGSLGLGRLVGRLRQPGAWLAGALLVGALLLVGTVVAARCLKGVVGMPGQVRPFGLMVGSSLGLLGPFCLVNGLLFPLACRAASEGCGEGGVGRVYMLEAAGAAAGGACHSFVLVHCRDPLVLAFLVAGLWCGAAAWQAARVAGRLGRGLAWTGTCGAAAACIACGSGWAARLARGIEDAYWRPLLLVRTTDSRYGRVAVTRQAGKSRQRSLYQNGKLAFSYPAPETAESIAHLPMLVHPHPRRVLLLGGGLGGVVEEILKHPSVERVTYVELDPKVLRAVRDDFAPEAARVLDDRRVEVEVTDSRAFLKGAGGRYDVVIAAEAPPTTAQANRFYTLEFFREVARVLEPGGVFAFRASGGGEYIPEAVLRLLACLRATLASGSDFTDVFVVPGSECTFLATNQGQGGGLRESLREVPERMRARGLETWYVDPSIWEAALGGRRLEELEAAFRREPAPPLNHDLSPRCYYYEAQRWSALQRPRGAKAGPSGLSLGGVLVYLERWPVVAPLAVLAALAAASLAVPLARRRWRDGVLAFAVAATGATQMALEFIVLIGFQVVYGYVYQYVGILVASFMLGLALGAGVSSAWVRRGHATWRRMTRVQAGICVCPLILFGFLVLAMSTGLSALPGFAGVLFGLVALTAGFVGGVQFPLAVALHSAGDSAAGTLYGLDLFGACLGALAVSSVLVPAFGLGWVCAMLSALGCLGLLGVVAAGRGARVQNRVDFGSSGR